MILTSSHTSPRISGHLHQILLRKNGKISGTLRRSSASPLASGDPDLPYLYGTSNYAVAVLYPLIVFYLLPPLISHFHRFFDSSGLHVHLTGDHIDPLPSDIYVSVCPVSCTMHFGCAHSPGFCLVLKISCNFQIRSVILVV